MPVVLLLVLLVFGVEPEELPAAVPAKDTLAFVVAGAVPEGKPAACQSINICCCELLSGTPCGIAPLLIAETTAAALAETEFQLVRSGRLLLGP